MVLPALGEENLAKWSEENNKNLMNSLCELERERKVWKSFEKDELNKSNSDFWKPYSRFSIDRNR